jgi:methyl coenzyme M reductase system subunit A2
VVNLLKVENLSKNYKLDGKNFAVLKNVSFQTEKGEILGFVGKSGGGKSTLMKILRGMENFDSGSINIDGLAITPDSGDDVLAEQRKITGIHLQRDFGLWTESALKNVVRRVHASEMGYEGLLSKHDARYERMNEEAMYYLQLVGLENKATHLATILSGGEKQRLLIARQLAKKPKLLLLDEPATMACPATKQEVLDTIKKVNRELDITILVVSHLPEIHEYISDRLIWLDNGEIKAEGSSDEVLKSFLSNLRKAEPLPERPAPKPEIQINDLSKRIFLFGVGEVLNIANMNFNINSGEITSLIGNSGAGKTTILNIMEGLKKPDDGEVLYRFGDQWVDMTKYSRTRLDVRRTLGIMYQEFALSPRETVLDQIAYKLGVKGQSVLDYARSVAKEEGISDRVLDILYMLTDMQEEEARNVLDSLGLTAAVFEDLFPRFPATEARKYAEPLFEILGLDPAILTKYPHQLSGGESVRVSLAILLAANPKILVLDEPFGDIDPITLRDVSNAIKRINREYGTTILLVSHHVDFVREVSHRAILIENGTLTMDDDPDEVCNIFISRSGASYLKKHHLDPIGVANQ